jgi:hypothetical protein
MVNRLPSNCFTTSWYLDESSVTGQSFQCSKYGPEPSDVGPISIIYNTATETITISGGISSEPRKLTLNENLVGYTKDVKVDSEEKSPGCTMTSYMSDGVHLRGPNTMNYMVAYSYVFSYGCTSYLRSIVDDILQGQAKPIFNAMYATDGIDLERIQDLTTAQWYIRYGATRNGTDNSLSNAPIVDIQDDNSRFAETHRNSTTTTENDVFTLRGDFINSLRTILP